MNPISALLVYFLIWWMVLFCVLPLNITRNTDKFEGSGAPTNPNLKKKFLLTTGISLVVWAFVCGIITSGLFDFRASSMKMIEDSYDKN